MTENERTDPRVFFAAERTLLAWVRTGLTVIGLGFVVARFGLFLRVMGVAASGSVGTPAAAAAPSTHLGSTLIGVLLVFVGAFSIALAAVQHVRFCRTLLPVERARNYKPHWSVWFAFLLAFLGLCLSVYVLGADLA